MEYRINKTSGFPIYQQIKEQIRYYLLNGDLQAGARMLSPKDLAAYVGINRNTVISAYRELEQEGLLVTRQGSGTFITEQTERLPALSGDGGETLDRLVSVLLEDARKLGYTPADVFTVLYGKIVLGIGRPEDQRTRILVIECNDEDASYFCREIEKELDVKTAYLIVQDLKNHMTDEVLLNADLIVTTVMHHDEVKERLEPLHKEVLALNAAPHLQTFMRIAQLPPGTRIGIVCGTESGACGMKQAIEDAGITGLHVEACGADDDPRIREIIQRVDWVITSRVAYPKLRDMARPDTQFMEFFQVMDKSGLAMLRQYLAYREQAGRGN